MGLSFGKLPDGTYQVDPTHAIISWSAGTESYLKEGEI
jgi:hypothetical protein